MRAQGSPLEAALRLPEYAGCGGRVGAFFAPRRVQPVEARRPRKKRRRLRARSSASRALFIDFYKKP
jgi:hypothetical protein